MSPDEEPRLALLDLSNVDGRFMPDLIEKTLHHIVEAWEAATAGPHEPLLAVANNDATWSLLEPGYDPKPATPPIRHGCEYTTQS